MVKTLGSTAPQVAPPRGERLSQGNIRSHYSYSDGEHELVLTSPEITEDQAAALEWGEAEFALVIEEPVVLLCARFGEAIPWSAAPVCWHATPRESRRLPPAPRALEESRAMIHVTLAEAETGLRRAGRNVTLWLEFTRALHEAIRDQARMILDLKEHERALSRLKLRYPTTESLVASARVRCVGSL